MLGRICGQEKKLQLLCSPVDDEGLVLPCLTACYHGYTCMHQITKVHTPHFECPDDIVIDLHSDISQRFKS